jgi:thiol-disulfide isomerase/thioredoxin
MKKVFKCIAIGLLSIAAVGACAAFLVLKFAEHKIESGIHSPRLEFHPEPAPDLVYSTLDGNAAHLASSKGKVVFLDLWGTWCIQCVVEMPRVQQLYDHYKSDPNVEFLIVSRMDTPSQVRAYAKRNHFDLPFYIMKDDDIPPSMQLLQYPATFLYARDGTLVSKHVGAADWSDPSVIAFIDKLKAK